MNYEILKTGSKGNCIIVENVFALDIGIPYKTIEPYLKDIKMIFISHRHTDHLNPATVRKIAFNHPNIKFICNEDVMTLLRQEGIKSKQSLSFKEGVWYDLGMCKIKLDYLIHDVPNSALHLIYHDKSLFYATDTSEIDHIVAQGYDNYLVEANYLTNDEIDQKIIEAKKNGEYTYLERAKHTHLSQLQILNWLDENMGEHSKYQFIHQHIDKGE